MFLKSLVLVVFVVAVAMVLLSYRQQRLEMMNEMTRLHGSMNQSREAMWDLQVKIADHIEPPALNQAIERAQLKLEPTLPSNVAPANDDAAPDQTPPARPVSASRPQVTKSNPKTPIVAQASLQRNVH